jgi:acetoacetyl-CoA synthetase
VPRTLSGKKLEVPVKRILLGTPTDDAASRDALADRRSLEPFEAFAAERARGHQRESELRTARAARDA